jgi:hypothetical protein
MLCPYIIDQDSSENDPHLFYLCNRLNLLRT